MRMNKWMGALIAAIILTPGFSLAATGLSCNATELRASCSQQAADLLTDIQRDNQDLRHYIRERQMNRARAELIDMRERVSKLEAMERNLARWEQQMIPQVAGQVRQLLANPDEESLYSQARALARTIQVDAHAARVDARAEYLAPNLGMTELFR